MEIQTQLWFNPSIKKNKQLQPFILVQETDNHLKQQLQKPKHSLR